MAKLPKLKSDLAINKEIKEKLRDQAGIKHWAYDSVGGLVAHTVATELARTHMETRDTFKSIQLPYAEGSDLDAIAAEWTGNYVQRTLATTASVGESEKSLYFYTSVGSFGEANNGQDILVPRGTVISTTNNPNSTNAIVYKTTKDYTLPKDLNIYYCSARATTIGSSMNCGKNTLKYFSGVSYAKEGLNYLRCANRFPVLNGSDLESDEDLRYRITLLYSTLAQNNLNSVRMTALTVPGIQQIRVIDGYYGIGSAGVVAVGIDNESSPALVAALQRKLMSMQSVGLRLIALPAVRVHFDFSLRCLVNKNLSPTDERRVRSAINRAIFTKMKDLEYSGAINFSHIGMHVVDSVPEINALIGTFADYFESIHYRKSIDQQMLGDADRRQIITNVFSLERDEFIALGNVDITFETDVGI